MTLTGKYKHIEEGFIFKRVVLYVEVYCVHVPYLDQQEIAEPFTMYRRAKSDDVVSLFRMGTMK